MKKRILILLGILIIGGGAAAEYVGKWAYLGSRRQVEILYM